MKNDRYGPVWKSGMESVEITFEILDEERESIQIHEYQSRNRV